MDGKITLAENTLDSKESVFEKALAKKTESGS
jgi:hypothetical protein